MIKHLLTEETLNNQSNKQTIKYDIQLSIPSIMSALHLQAISKINPEKDNARIANSAIEGDGKTAKLKSAGQHIISVLAIDQKKGKIKKSIALKYLKTYVQWFVGPDLESKVTDNVIISLDDNKTNPSESFKLNKSFSQFLFEHIINEENEITTTNSEVAVTNNENLKDADTDNDNSNEKINDNNSDEDSKDPSSVGWCIAYNLKVQGLKESSLSDSLKQFARSFLDELTITASGLFGGGKSVSGKDIRKEIHKFKHIDHKKLASNVDSYIKKKFPQIQESEVKSRDNVTLYKELAQYLDKDQKTRLRNSQYSLQIKIKEEDPKQPFLNPQKIADIIRKNISSFRIGTKAKLTKDSIIYIKDFIDKNDSSSLKNNAKRPSGLNIQELIEKVKADDKGLISITTALSLYKKIESLFNRIKNDKKASQENENKKALEIFAKLTANIKKIKKDDKTISKKIFDDFLDEYMKFDSSFDESLSTSKYSNVMCLMLEDIFGNNSYINEIILKEANDEENNTETKITSDTNIETSNKNDNINADKTEETIDNLKTQFKTLLTNAIPDVDAKITINEKDKVIAELDYPDKSKLESILKSNDEFNYCIVVDFDKKSKITESKEAVISLDSKITNEKTLFNLLFENDISDKEWSQIVSQHANGDLTFPQITDTNTNQTREMSDNEVIAGLQSDTIEYKNKEFKTQTKDEVLKNADASEAKDAATELKTNIDDTETTLEEKIRSVFDEFKKSTKLDETKNFGEFVILKKEVSVNESVYNISNDSILLIEKSIYSDTGRKKIKDVVQEIERVGADVILSFKNNLRKNLQTQRSKGIDSAKDKKDKERIVQLFNFIQKFFDDLFTKKTTDEMVKLVNDTFDDNTTIGRTTQVWRVFDRAHLPDSEKSDDNQQSEPENKIKISWFDIDPTSGKKHDKPLRELDIESGTAINSSDEAQNIFTELNKQLSDEKKDGYVFSGWNPSSSTKVTENTDVLATYDSIKKPDDIVSHAVIFMYNKNPIDSSEGQDIIDVNGEPIQAVIDGEKAARPNEKDIPIIQGYKFIDWGDSEDKLDSVKEDIEAIAHYEPEDGTIPISEDKVKVFSFVMPFAYYQKTDDKKPENEDKNPKPEDSTDIQTNIEDKQLEKPNGTDLYIYPIESAEDFESDKNDTTDGSDD